MLGISLWFKWKNFFSCLWCGVVVGWICSCWNRQHDTATDGRRLSRWSRVSSSLRPSPLSPFSVGPLLRPPLSTHPTHRTHHPPPLCCSSFSLFALALSVVYSSTHTTECMCVCCVSFTCRLCVIQQQRKTTEAVVVQLLQSPRRCVFTFPRNYCH